MKRAMILVSLALLALVFGIGIGIVSADDPGNSDAAKMCQQGGYLNLMGEDGTLFNNVGECVSYAARGGKLVPRCGDITVSVQISRPCTYHCTTSYDFTIRGTNFSSNANLTVQVVALADYDMFSFSVARSVTTDASGSFELHSSWGAPDAVGLISFTATVTEGGCGSDSIVFH
jgi:hypothetical protein